jgi:hypothetical protein
VLCACSGSKHSAEPTLEQAQTETVDAGQRVDDASVPEMAIATGDTDKAQLSLRAIVPATLTAGDTFRVVCELTGDAPPSAADAAQPQFEPKDAVEVEKEKPGAGTFRARRAGTVKVRCELPVPELRDRLREQTDAELKIAPGKLAKLETQLDKANVPAGTLVRVSCRGRDAYDNETSDPAITRVIMPAQMGNTFDGDKLRVEHAGEYEALCQHPHAMVQGAKLKVVPGLPSSLQLRAEPYRAEYPPNETVNLKAAASDAFGNAVADAEIALDVPQAGSEKVAEGTYRFQEGTHPIHAQVKSKTHDGKVVEAQLDLHVDGGPPRITCDEPLDGSSLVTQSDRAMLRGRVADGSGIAEVDVDGQRVPVKDGAFAQEVAVGYGLNFIDVKAVDGVGTPNRQLCSFTASPRWTSGTDTSTVTVQLGQRALDDGERSASPSSMADLLQTAMESPSFRDAVDAKLKERRDLKPSSCDQSILGGCIMRSGVQYVELTLGGPHDLTLTLTDGGIHAHVNLRDVRLRARVYGMLTGIDFDSLGWVSMDKISAEAILDTAAAGGRPRVSMRADSVHTDVGNVDTNFSDVDGAVIDLLADLFNGSLRSELTSAIDSVLNHQLSDALGDVLAGLDVSALGTTLRLPKLTGEGEVAAELSLSLLGLTTTSERLQLEIATHVQGSASDGTARPISERGYPFRAAPDATLLGDQAMAVSIHEVLVTQLVQGLWQGGLLEASIAPGEVKELPKELSGHVSFDAPPIAELSGGRVVLSAGSVAVELSYPGLFGTAPLRARAGVRLSAALKLESGRIALSDYKIDDLRFGTDRRDFESAQNPTVRASIIKLMEKQLRPTLERALLSIPVPTLAVPSVLVGAGFSAGDRLGLLDPALRVDSPQGVVAGGLGLLH